MHCRKESTYFLFELLAELFSNLNLELLADLLFEFLLFRHWLVIIGLRQVNYAQSNIRLDVPTAIGQQEKLQDQVEKISSMKKCCTIDTV
jgi:hypothetical protein